MRRMAMPGLAGLLAMFVLGALVFAASPSLHHRLHQDAGHDEHVCAVCLFASGQINAAETLVAVAGLVLAFGWSFTWSLNSALTQADLRLAPSRAPPLL